jgi:nitric oxide dioxygenase
MTSEQIELVRKSWDLVAGDPDGVAALFYRRLFAAAPGVRPLFPASMQEQGRKLVQMLATAVANLDKLEAIRPAVEALARRHVGYGALPEHYPVVGEALLAALDDGLGPQLTPETTAAWAAAYAALSQVMLEAAAGTTARAQS